MRLTIIAIAILIFLYNCNNDKPVSQEKFTQIYRDSLAMLHPAASYTIANDLRIIANFKGKEISHFLVNAYNEYKGHPGSLKSIMSRYCRSSLSLYKEEPININKIIPVIKEAGYIDSIKTLINENTIPTNDLQLVYDVYNEKLVILYAEDIETNITFITQERFRELGLSKDSLLPVALRNLTAVLPAIKTNPDNSLNIITAGGKYETSLILLNNIWTLRNIQVEGKIIIAIPARGLLFVTGTNNINGINRLKEKANEAWQNGKYRLLPDLFIWNGNKFEIFK